MIHQLINTAFAHSAPVTGLSKFARTERIENIHHAAEMIKEIIVEKRIANDEEKEYLTRLFRFVNSAPYGVSLSRCKVSENGDYISG